MNLVHQWNINTSFTLLYGLTTLLPCRPTLRYLIFIVKVLWILWCFSFCRLQGAHGSPRHSSIYNNSRSKYNYNGNQFSKSLWHHQTVPITKIVLEHAGSRSARAPSQYAKRRLFVTSRKVSKPRDLYLELSDRSEIWQALRQHCCRCACQISKWYDNLKYQSRGFETSRDFTKRRLFGYWDGDLFRYVRSLSSCKAVTYRRGPYVVRCP